MNSRQTAPSLIEADTRYKYLDPLITLFVVVLLISNLIARKFFDVGPFTVSAAQLAFPLTYIFGDIFTEVYGYSASRRAIWYGFFSAGILVVIGYISVIIPASPDFKDEAAFETMFKPIGRIVAASLLAYWCGEFANSFTMAKMKLLTRGNHLWTRTIGSTVVGQAVDTTVVICIVFYDQPFHTIFSLIWSGYVIKVGYEALMTPVTYWVIRKLKKAEGVDVFDSQTDFNPFAIRATRRQPAGESTLPAE